MEEQVVAEEIKCLFQEQDEIKIFDKDNWNQNIPSQSDKYIQEDSDEDVKKHNQQMKEKLNNELVESKSNFYSVKVSKQIKNKPKTQKQIRPRAVKPIHKQKMQTDITNPSRVLKQGYLSKKTDGFFFKWNVRYMVLTSEKLYSFEDQKKQKVVGCINIKLLSVSVKMQKDQDNYDILVLDFNNECENVILKSQVVGVVQEWKNWLTTVINYQSKENKLLIMTINKPIYQSKDFLSQKQLMLYAQTGDILLFYTENTGAKIQRVLTMSEVDHVAMIVRIRANELMVFESNQMHGVSVYQWKQYIHYFDLYQKVILRKLNHARKTDLHHTLLSFVKKNLGKKYEIGAFKLLKLQSDCNWQTINKEINQQRGYFCSQLIAKAYKSVGLLQPKKSSAKYWPVDFSEKQNLHLQNGAYLGPEQLVILNKHTKKII